MALYVKVTTVIMLFGLGIMTGIWICSNTLAPNIKALKAQALKSHCAGEVTFQTTPGE